mmetsp:Transcript_2883/g.3866  ORF Transcript_2883/g.3866 Transcript_2883/m.3866 type:complete len:395 (-) Transcript_2883:405-1589(-)|eukprot:CAMPEP_0198141832 /NCGR_PEP_ID=MMETSP1443-20131203/4766_1 /TAXON_ID=186043 /ORGANISM="Entomoneis sp., Strain CCMP2396" /LENGTH=394 /DNA_ID=CAMNT_0043804695 /DNA_START=52 /DNA_END=1236 /DNA_ORIENTATION=-
MSESDLIETIHLLAKLLSSQQSKDQLSSSAYTASGRDRERNRFEALIVDNNDQIEFSSPALSLVHDDRLVFDHGNRSEAENSAFQLLSREMVFHVDLRNNDNDNDDGDAGPMALERLSGVGQLHLGNVSESFALLVDSGLRAHAKFLSEHSHSSVKRQQDGSISLLEQKLEKLLEIGNRITISRMETNVKVAEAEQNESQGELNSLMSAINFQASLNLCMESPDGSLSSYFPVRFESGGYISVCRTTSELRTCHFKLQVDTKDLLAQMKLQALGVVAQVVDMTNSFFMIPDEPSLHRGDSYLVMPPPPSNKGAAGSQDTKDVSSKSFALVDYGGVSPFIMDDQELSDGSSVLSLDQCANILDDVFGNIDLSLFSGFPDDKTLDTRPAKKSKSSE